MIHKCLDGARHMMILSRTFQGNNAATLADTDTLMSAQYVHVHFPRLPITAELNFRTNVRFIKFNAHESSAPGIDERRRPVAATTPKGLSDFTVRAAFMAGQTFT